MCEIEGSHETWKLVAVVAFVRTTFLDTSTEAMTAV